MTAGDYNFAGCKVLADTDEARTKPVSESSGFKLNQLTLTIDPLTIVFIKLNRKVTDYPGNKKITKWDLPPPSLLSGGEQAPKIALNLELSYCLIQFFGHIG
nr:hypothetical protein [Bacillus sp. REN3]